MKKDIIWMIQAIRRGLKLITQLKFVVMRHLQQSLVRKAEPRLIQGSRPERKKKENEIFDNRLVVVRGRRSGRPWLGPGLVESHVLRLVFLYSSLQSPGQEKHFGILFIPLHVVVREIHCL